MKAIYASKIYKSSKRKERIVAAMQNPSNSKLLVQLGSYLDEEYRTPANLGLEEPTEPEIEVPDELNPGLDEDFNPSENLVDYPSGPRPSHTSVSPTFDNDEMPEGPDLDVDIDQDTPAHEVPQESEDAEVVEVEESTQVTQSSVTACVNIDAAVLKGSLNSREDTCGVNRIMTKESELWIYYNDDVNLNNIMSNVIEYLNASGETYLEFNRLARSDNAMVFQINESARDIEPINR